MSWLHRVLTSCGPKGRTTGNCDARKDNLRLELLKAVRRKLRPARRTKAPTQHKRIATRSYTPMTSTHRAHIIVHPLPSRKTSFLLIQSHALNLFHGMGYLFFVDAGRGPVRPLPADTAQHSTRRHDTTHTPHDNTPQCTQHNTHNTAQHCEHGTVQQCTYSDVAPPALVAGG